VWKFDWTTKGIGREVPMDRAAKKKRGAWMLTKKGGGDNPSAILRENVKEERHRQKTERGDKHANNHQ